MSDTQSKIGKLLEDGEQRDAIHVAVAPVLVGAGRMDPGEPAGLDEHGRAVLPQGSLKPVGIIDPFLASPVYGGDRCWLFLYPQTVTDMRHHWTHPAFAAEAAPAPVVVRDKDASERWLREFIATADCPDYDVVMAAAVGEHEKNDSSNNGQYLHFDGRDAHGVIPREFWDHVETVSGKTVPDVLRARFFSCSC